ncbi:MAG: (2Fe-2S)-binding protein [Planctomycetota bacterium]|jgi:NAD(P)H-nitrite reductase large subunit
MPRPDLSQPGDESSRRICYCVRVHEATILRAIAEGCGSVEEIRNLTGAATGCGTCRFDLEVLLRRAPRPPSPGIPPGTAPED